MGSGGSADRPESTVWGRAIGPVPRKRDAPTSGLSRTDTLCAPNGRGNLPVPAGRAANTSQCYVATHEIDHS